MSETGQAILQGSAKAIQSGEVLNGRQIFSVACPSVCHNRVVRNLLFLFHTACREKGYEVFSRMTVYFSEDSIVVPDLVVVRDPALAWNDGIHGVPDLIVEATAPDRADRIRREKLELYRTMGVAEFWIVEPVAKFVEIHRLAQGRYELLDIVGMFQKEIWQKLSPDEQAAFPTEWRTPLLENAVFRLVDVFGG